jgi:hypothetical protein
MTDLNLPAHLRVDEAEHIPTDGDTSRLREKAMELGSVESELEKLAKRTTELNARKTALSFREIPDIMAELGIDSLGLPELNADIVEKPYYKASIPASWPDERRQAAFDWLEKNGHGSLVKVNVTVSFGKSELEKARELETLIRGWSNEHTPELSMDVHWGTLTSFVKEQVTKGEVVPLETLGAEVGRIAVINRRK